MLQKALILIFPALIISSIAYAQTNPVPADRLYPKTSTETTALVVVDLGRDNIDGQVAACGLQGIVNRAAGKKVYVMNTYCYDNHGGWKEPGTGRRQAQ